MPDLNAGLLQVNNLSDVIRNSNQDAQNQRQGLINNLGQSAMIIKQNNDNDTLKGIVDQNFDPSTKQVNHDQVIQQLYNVNPDLAQKYAANLAQTQQASQVANANLMKTQSDTAKNMADANKTTEDSNTIQLKNTMQHIQNGAQLLLGVNDQAGWDNAIKFGKSKGFDMGPFENMPYSPQAKQQAYTQLMDAKDTLQNQLDQAKQNTEQYKADTGRMTANTEFMKANQDYSINKEKNAQGWADTGIKQQTANQDWNKNFIATPEQQLNIAKANIDLQDKQIKNQGETQSALQKYQYSNNINQNIIDSTNSILNNVVQKDKDGKPLVDSDGNPLLKKDNFLGNATKRAFYLKAPGNNDYKQLDSTINTLVGQVTGKSMQDIKSMFGSQGPVTDSDAKTFSAMQGLVSSQDFYNLPQNMQVRILSKIQNNALNGIEENKKQAAKVQEQAQMVQNQSLPSRMPQNTGAGIQVGAPLVGFNPKGFTASNGKTYDPNYLMQKYGKQ